MKNCILIALVLAFAACTQSTETSTNRTITPEGDTIVTTTTTTSETGLDSSALGETGERLQTTGSEIKEEIKEGAHKVKEEWKETKNEVKNRRENHDTIVVKKTR